MFAPNIAPLPYKFRDIFVLGKIVVQTQTANYTYRITAGTVHSVTRKHDAIAANEPASGETVHDRWERIRFQ
ncbi:hypothetical protein AG1IA_05538 [Rhizoctonia solani AG-1 IA]|uniref:Uncharacterized protein n=1 Tax=Thanatephorus cucumeris (strain AG1-IA) TaxID=983506 RepID=L8WVQ4_THACA|nr:hypothetical protein AG1IA_05538 [Rhizoctonia solani AG-1 IA]